MQARDRSMPKRLLQLTLVKGKIKPNEKEIKTKADEIFKSSSTYEEICWLIANLTLIKEKKIDGQKL